MADSELISKDEGEVSQQSSLPFESHNQLENPLLVNDSTNVEQNISTENQTSSEKIVFSSQDTNVVVGINSDTSTDSTVPPLPPLPKDGKEQLPQTQSSYPADYNMQNYANYNYAYNYNNYYGYPYPQYQWDYNSQQYYQPYQNYYNFNYNANQAQSSNKPPPPPPDAVQLPVEEKPNNKTSSTTVDDSNRYSPTAETDDDDAMKGLTENNKSDTPFEQPTQPAATLSNSVLSKTVPQEQIEIQQSSLENIENKNKQPIVPSVVTPQFNIPVQPSSYLINSQIQMQSTEVVNDPTNQHQKPIAVNGKDESTEKMSKGSTVLGKNQAKKRLMAFSMMKQKLLEQNNSNNDSQNLDVGEGNDVEFVPEHNVFQTVTKKKVVTNKKVVKVIKAQQTIEQIEEMKKDEFLQGNNAALYQHLLRSGGNEAPILQKLGIESLAEKYSAKIREQDKRSSKRHHHRHRDDRRSHKYHRRSHSKSRSRSRSAAEKPKMRALDVKSWKDFVSGGFHFDKFRRLKMDEAEEIKEKERKSRSKKRHGDSRSDGKNQNNESIISTEMEKGNGDLKLRYNILDRKKDIIKSCEVLTQGDYTKEFPSYIIQYTKAKPVLKYSYNPAKATCHLQNRQQMLATLLPEIEAFVYTFLTSMKPKRLKENYTENYNHVDNKLVVLMKDKNIYPFKGWWPKKYFIITDVREDPRIEIDKDALINEFNTSKRTKKSRFDDDTSLVDLRPTVPSKWDSDYDGSPIAEKGIDVEVGQNALINSRDSSSFVINRQENNLPDICLQGEKLGTVSDIGEDDIKIKVNIEPIVLTSCEEPQEHVKLDTEYENFLKTVSVEMDENTVNEEVSCLMVPKEAENNFSIKSASLNEESVQDESEEDLSTKSSDESVSLQNIVEESIDESFVKSVSSVDKKLKKKKKSSNKKSKKSKKKEGKRKKHKSSSSESSQDSDFESDSSSEDSDSDTSDSVSTVEKKKKKKKSKDKKKKKSKSSYKKKRRADKSKTKKPEDEKNGDSILNLLEKAFNVEIKKRPLDDEESKQQKKRRKHEKKENMSSDENEDNFEKVKECLKETITKLVKTDKVSKNPSISCVDNSVSEVLKYFQFDEDKEKKNKKSKKSSKRKHNSNVSSDEILTKQSRLAISSMLEDMEKKSKKKKKKSTDKKSDSDEYVSKKKLKKKLKTSDTSGTEDDEGSKYKKSKKEKEPEHFFGLRPNEWNTNKISSMRGVVHQSDVKNKNCTLSELDTSELDSNLNENLSSNSDGKNLGSPNVFESSVGPNDENKVQLVMSSKSIQNDTDSILKNIDEKRRNDFRDLECSVSDAKESSINNDGPQSALSANDYNKQQDLNKDANNFLKPTENQPLIQNEKPVMCAPIQSAGEAISYRDKVKMNLKKLSNCKLDIPFVFGLSTPFALVKPSSFNREKRQESVVKEEVKLPLVDESFLLRSEGPKADICPQSQNENPPTPTVSPKIDSKADMEVLDSSYTWEDSDESSVDKSSVASTSTSENSSDEEECDQIKLNSLEKDENQQQSENETSSNDEKVTVATETSSSLYIENNVKSSEFSGYVNTFEKEQILTPSYCLIKSEEQFEGDTAVLHNYTESVKLKSPLSNYDSELPINSNVNKEYFTIDSELITSWTSDWNKFDKSVTEAYNFGNSPCLGESQTKKKSRWDDESKDNRMSKSQEEFKDEMSNYTATGKSENSNVWSHLVSDNDFEDQNRIYEITSDNYTNDDYYSATWSNEYVDSQYYNQSSDIPQYSEIKTIESERLSPVDYSIYENYNPSSYNDNGEDGDLWKLAVDNSQLTTIEQLSSTKVGNDLEFLSSDHVSNNVTEFSKDELVDENILSPHVEDVVVENVKSSGAHRDKQFFQLYQLHFEHYSQNPIKYSITEPIIDNKTDINLSVAETLPTEDNVLDADQQIDKTIPIPLQSRAYFCLVEDNSNKLYITSDNYLAYCASDDKCMVHIAVNSSRRDGLQDEVRHCFNTNENGTANEYWLHADLIPFVFPSDADSGVLSDEEDEAVESDQEDDIVGNDDNEEEDEENDDSVDGDMIEGNWVMVDSDSDNGDSWLDDPRVFDKYRENDMDDVEVTHTDNDREESEASFSDYDTESSDCTDSGIETSSEKQNIIVNPIQKPDEMDCKKNLPCIMDEDTFVTVKSDTLLETDNKIALLEQLDSNVDTKNTNNTSEPLNDLTSDVKTENCNENITEEKENFNFNEPCLLQTREIKVDEVTNMYTIVSQQMLIQKLKNQAKEKIQTKLPDSALVCYSDNMETVKHPFLGLFQPPTISILSKKRTENEEKEEKPKKMGLKFLKLSKRVIFADGIHPGDDLAASSTHDAVSRSFSPPPLKALMRETLKCKQNIFAFKKSKVRTKLTMLNKKVAKVMPSIKCTTSSTEYYISRRHLENLSQMPPFLNNDVVDRSNNSPYNDDDDDSCDSSRPTRELTPVPSDNEGWDDGEGGNNIEIDR